jgi:hypothetical protein
MRSKEDAQDYRYFPDPDLPPLVIDEPWIARVRAELPELPEMRRMRFAATSREDFIETLKNQANPALVDVSIIAFVKQFSLTVAAQGITANTVHPPFTKTDRYPKRLLLGGIYLLRSLALALFFMFPPTPLSVVLFGAAMGTLWLGVIPLVNGLVVQLFGLRFLSTLTGIAFLSHQAGSFLGAWGGGYLFDLMGSYDLAWKIGAFVGLVAGTMQLLMNDRPTARMQALQAVTA